MMAFMCPPPNRRKRRTANWEQLNSPATASRPLVQTTTATDPSPCTLSPRRRRGGKGLRRLNGASPSDLVGGGGLEPPTVGRSRSLLRGTIPPDRSRRSFAHWSNRSFAARCPLYHPGGLTSPHIPPEA